MLNLVLKIWQKNYIACTRKWATTPKERTFTTANTSGCGACCSRPTKTTSWKRRRNRPSTSGFLLVENAWNNFRQVASWNTNTICHRQFGAIFQVFIVSSSSTLCMRRMFILVLPHNENKLHPIHRTIKSQDNFTERSQHERLFPAFVLHYKQKQLTLQSNKQRDY